MISNEPKHYIIHLEPIDVVAENEEEAKRIYKERRTKPPIMRVVPANISLLTHKQLIESVD